MLICPNCGTSAPEGASICTNCGSAINQVTSMPNYQFQAKNENPTTFSNDSASSLQLRLEKAMRRTEILTYAALGLGAAILAVIIIISLL